MNTYNPQRTEGEKFADYKKRRVEAKARAVQCMKAFRMFWNSAEGGMYVRPENREALFRRSKGRLA